jgi:hypothetical protein
MNAFEPADEATGAAAAPVPPGDQSGWADAPVSAAGVDGPRRFSDVGT